MSTDTSVPQPRVPGLDAWDSALLETLVAQAPIGFALLDTEAVFRRVNLALAQMTGCKPADHLGRTPRQVWPQDLAARAEAAVHSVLADGRPCSDADLTAGAAADLLAAETVAAPRADLGPEDLDPDVGAHFDASADAVLSVDLGTKPAVSAVPAAAAATSRAAAGQDAASPDGAGGTAGEHLALSWYPAFGLDGSITGVAVIAVDTSGEQDAAEAVRRTEERYRSLVQAGAQVVWVTTPAGQVAEDSPEWRWITGQSVAEYLAGGWLAAVHPDDRETVEREWLDCVRTGTVFDSRYRVHTKSGAYRHYDVRAVPVERDGAIVEWIGASTDVTGQREAEEMRGRLTEQLSAAALRTARLQQATSMLAEALTVEQVVGVITEVGGSAIGAERSAVALVSQDRLRLKIINPEGFPDSPGAPTGSIPLDTPSVMTAAIATRRPLVLESPDALRRYFEDEDAVDATLYLHATDERAWVGLPLITSGAPLGALRFSFTSLRQITDEERVFLAALAGQCALALERAALFEREHATAETLQRSLLPDTLPEVPGMVLKARYKPLTIEVGGDWYDAFRLPDGRLAVAAGDVMGKGLTAAAGMGRVRNALRALALTDPRPAAVLAGLDRLFSATELEDQVTTVCYLVVDPRTGEGMAGNAGHLPPLLLAPGRPARLDQTEAGTPLGWPSPRQQYPFRLPAGNTAVLYSDGLVENRNRGLDVGLDELVAVADQAPQEVVSDPERLIDYLVDRMLTGYEQDDDVTVLVLQMPAAGTARPAAVSGSVTPRDL